MNEELGEEERTEKYEKTKKGRRKDVPLAHNY
jgi:hypothetical protein